MSILIETILLLIQGIQHGESQTTGLLRASPAAHEIRNAGIRDVSGYRDAASVMMHCGDSANG